MDSHDWKERIWAGWHVMIWELIDFLSVAPFDVLELPIQSISALLYLQVHLDQVKYLTRYGTWSETATRCPTPESDRQHETSPHRGQGKRAAVNDRNGRR